MPMPLPLALHCAGGRCRSRCPRPLLGPAPLPPAPLQATTPWRCRPPPPTCQRPRSSRWAAAGAAAELLLGLLLRLLLGLLLGLLLRLLLPLLLGLLLRLLLGLLLALLLGLLLALLLPLPLPLPLGNSHNRGPLRPWKPPDPAHREPGT